MGNPTNLADAERMTERFIADPYFSRHMSLFAPVYVMAFFISIVVFVTTCRLICREFEKGVNTSRWTGQILLDRMHKEQDEEDKESSQGLIAEEPSEKPERMKCR